VIARLARVFLVVALLAGWQAARAWQHMHVHVPDRLSIQAEVDALGGELAVKKWVAPRLVAGWPRMMQASMDVPRDGVTPDLLATVALRPEPYVALLRRGIVQQVVDRDALSARLAEALA